MYARVRAHSRAHAGLYFWFLQPCLVQGFLPWIWSLLDVRRIITIVEQERFAIIAFHCVHYGSVFTYLRCIVDN